MACTLIERDAAWAPQNATGLAALALDDGALEVIAAETRRTDDEIVRQYIAEHGEDLPEIRNSRWKEEAPASSGSRTEE